MKPVAVAIRQAPGHLKPQQRLPGLGQQPLERERVLGRERVLEQLRLLVQAQASEWAERQGRQL